MARCLLFRHKIIIVIPFNRIDTVKRVMRILTQLLSVALLLAIQPYTVFGQSRPKVVIGYASMSSVVTTLWVAQELSLIHI